MPPNLDFKKNLTSKIFLIAVLAVSGIMVFFLSRPSPALGPETLAAQFKEACLEETLAKEKCYAKEMATIAEAEGHEFAFQTLFALQKIDRSAQGCHFISHGIGEGAYKRDPGNWQQSLQTINQACNYGAMHGIMENYVASLPGGTLTPEVVASLCSDSPRGDCNHSVGHLLLVESSADLDKALAFCDVFRDNPQQLEHCYTGVFMEYQTALNLIAHDLVPESWLDWKSRIGELEKMCRSFSGLKASACWREISHTADVALDHDPKKIFDFCESAQVDDGKKQCRSHAVAILATHWQFDMDKLKPICELPQRSDPNFTGECYITLGITNLNQVPQAAEKVKQYCLSLPTPYQETCLGNTASISRQSPLILD